MDGMEAVLVLGAMKCAKDGSAKLYSQLPFFSVPKNNAQSKKYREEGNNNYAKSTELGISTALKFYNQSICFAENDSEELSLGYSNRSAACMKLKMYEACLENIEMARSVAGCPAMLTEKLSLRESKCKQLQLSAANKNKKISGPPLEPKLSYPPHPTVPFIVNCLELRDNESGRHVVTTKDLKMGQIISIDEPFCKENPSGKRYELCENCYRANNNSLIPCKGCTLVMFCGEQCYEEAMQRFHKYECPAIDYLQELCSKPGYLFPLRMTLCALSSFASPDDLKTYIAGCHPDGQEKTDVNVFNTDYSDGDMKPYGPIYGMKRRMTNSNLFQQQEFLHNIACMLMLKSELKDSIGFYLWYYTFVMIDQHVHTAAINTSTYAFMNFNESEYIRSISPFRSLLSRSSVPNTHATYFGNKIVISVLRPIKAGESILDSWVG